MWNNWPLACRILAELAAGTGIALLLRRFVCMFVYVKGKSMMDTLRDGEIIFALRKGMCREIRRFDVVLCRYPGRKGMFVKRVVALPGERLFIQEGVLHIDGEPKEEDFPLRASRRSLDERQVPEGSYFLLGDNRLGSHDSRNSRVGAIAEGEILGVAKCVVLPPWRMRRI